MQYLLGKINFVRRFVPRFVENVKPLQDMIKKDVEFIWSSREKESSITMREEIAKAPSLLSLDFIQDFILYMFSFDTTFASILTQINKEGN
jgi:hypothetical protein